MPHTHQYKPLFFTGTCENIVLQWARIHAQYRAQRLSKERKDWRYPREAEQWEPQSRQLSTCKAVPYLSVQAAEALCCLCVGQEHVQLGSSSSKHTDLTARQACPTIVASSYTWTGANIWELSQETDEYPLQHMWNSHTFQR